MRHGVMHNVGDGLALFLEVAGGQTLRVDCGSQQGGEAPANTLLQRSSRSGTFVLSHFHADHYNGLAWHRQRCRDHADQSLRMQLTQAYYPRIPDIRPDTRQRQEFLKCLFAMNATIFGSRTGVMAYDFLRVLSEINETPFSQRGLSEGDPFRVGSIQFSVLWPPPEMDDADTIAAISKAIKAFHGACREHEETRWVYESIVQGGVVEDYLATRDVREAQMVEPEPYPATPDERAKVIERYLATRNKRRAWVGSEDIVEQPREAQADKKYPGLWLPEAQAPRQDRDPSLEWARKLTGGWAEHPYPLGVRELPPVVKEANSLLRTAANRLSLAFHESDRLLFLGDLEAAELKRVVKKLKDQDQTHFEVLITPHHGTHWDNSLNALHVDLALSSTGPKLFDKVHEHEEEYRKLAVKHYITHESNELHIESMWAVTPSPASVGDTPAVQA